MLYSLLCVDSQTTWNFKAEMSSAQVQSLWRLKCKKWSFTLGFKNDSPKIKGSDFSDGEGACAYGGLMVCTTNGEDGSFQLKLCELQPRWFSFRTSVLYDIQKKRKKKSEHVFLVFHTNTFFICYQLLQIIIPLHFLILLYFMSPLSLYFNKNV